MNVLEKTKQVKEKLIKEFPKLSEKEFIKITQKLANKWQYKKLKDRRQTQLDELELKIYEFLVKHKYKPSTVYKWFLLKNSAQEIKDRLREKEVSQRDAFQIKRTTKGILNSNETDLKNDLIDLVDRYIIR